jgi:hypothetical protein
VARPVLAGETCDETTGARVILRGNHLKLRRGVIQWSVPRAVFSDRACAISSGEFQTYAPLVALSGSS